MPDTGFLLFSVFCLVAGVLFILFPDALLNVNRFLNRIPVVLDERLMRYRYVVGLLLFAVSYGLFQVALLVPTLRG